MIAKTEMGPPADRDAEQWVVGSCILNPAAIDDLGFLAPEAFFHDDLRQLFAAMVESRRRGEPIDEALLRRQFNGDEWMARIGEITTAVPVAGHVQHYAGIVREVAQRRRLRELCLRAADDAQRGDVASDAILERVEAELSTISAARAEHEPVMLADVAIEAVTRIDAIARRGKGAGLPTGFPSFDQDQGGLQPGELAILAARPGLGKTSFALQVAEHNAAHGRMVYFASLEMSVVELSTRLACAQSEVSNRLIRIGQLSGDDTAALSEAFNAHASMKLVIHDRPHLTVAGIRREIRKRRKDLALVCIDYLQLLSPEDRKVPREQQVARMVRDLKITAREFEIPILCLCQLNRQVDGDETPRLHHLRESGAIEQDADVVLFLSKHEPKEGEPHNAVLTVAKNRNGETGPLRMAWDGPRTRFECFGYHDEFSQWST